MRVHSFFRSLSGRLVLLFVGMGLLFLVLVGATMGRAFHAHFEETLRPHLVQYLDYVQADIGSPPNYVRAEEISRTLPLTIQIAGPQGTWVSQGEPVDIAAHTEWHHGERNGRRYSYGNIGNREYLLVRDHGYTYVYSIPGERPGWRIALPLAVLLLILALLYHATRRLFSPVQTIRVGVERIGRGELDHRIAVRGCDELSQLACSINGMADDVQQMLDSKRQLLLAISHELRSPLTRAKVATSLVDDAPQRVEIERELNDLEKLIEELLETERLATRHQALHKQTVNLNELARDVIANLRGEVPPVVIAPEAPLEANVDSVRIKLLLRNLLENASRHTPPDAPAPELRLGYETRNSGATMTRMVEIIVSDHGPGIAAEHLPHVTEPFYRVDPARQRETGGYGLGLYLCRRIAEVHGGDLMVTSEPSEGTRVRVVLPI